MSGFMRQLVLHGMSRYIFSVWKKVVVCVWLCAL